MGDEITFLHLLPVLLISCERLLGILYCLSWLLFFMFSEKTRPTLIVPVS